MEYLVHNDASPQERAERRSDHRRRVFKGAVLTFNGLGAFEGVVRNQSEKGAKLHFGDTVGVPAIFDLTVSGSNKKLAQVRWRSSNAIGVEFV